MVRAIHSGSAGGGVGAWVVTADLFAGILLFVLMGVALFPRPASVRFTERLVEAMNTATQITAAIERGLRASLPADAPPVLVEETQVSIPSGALFRSFGYDDFVTDPTKLRFLGALRDAVRLALDAVEPSRRRFVKVIIEGHTDSNPIVRAAVTRAIPTNWELSARRATGVLRFFAEGGMGAADYNIVAVGLADTVQAAPNTTEEGRAANRRIIIRITPDIEAIRASIGARSR